MPNHLSRRALLAAVSAAGATALLAACRTVVSSTIANATPTSTPAPRPTTRPLPPNGNSWLARQPYLQALNETEVTISWAGQSAQGSWLAIGPEDGALQRYDAAPSTAPSVTVGTLQPNTRYTYEIGVGDTPLTPRYTFHSAPGPDGTECSFLVFGDTGEGDAAQRDLPAQVVGLKSDIALHVGDFLYGKHATFDNRYFQPYAAMLSTTAVFPAIGDNDTQDKGGKPFRQAFVRPVNVPPQGNAWAYAFDYGPAHFIALDTEAAFDAQSPQYQWLAADLAQTQRPWKIVYFHRPVYTADPARAQRAIREAWCPLFERFGVQIVFSGHDHNYQRSRPVHDFSRGPGVVYVVAGGGGATLRPVTSGDVMSVVAATHHVVQVQIRADTAIVRAVTAQGDTLDETTVARS